jgi:uncharacterized cupredoxin-like copper-binding protein
MVVQHDASRGRTGTALSREVIRVNGTRKLAVFKVGIVAGVMVAMLGVGAGSAVAGSRANASNGAAAAKKPVSVVTVTLGDTAGLNGPMTMTVSPATVPAGKVKFVATNSGTVIHELIVLKTKLPFDKLPVTDAGDPPHRVSTGANKVDEGKNIGETGDIGKGKTKSVTLKLKKGSYVLVCNIAQHYGLGMRAAFTVTK